MVELLFILGVELFVIALATELLTRRVPPVARQISHENRFRVDGSFSPRRSRRENEASMKLRTDLWAVFLIIAVTGNGLALAIHNFVIPIPLGIQALAMFGGDYEEWKRDLEKEGIGGLFQDWHRSRNPEIAAAERARSQLWYAWPFVLLGCGAWAAGSFYILRMGHNRALREYITGVKFRSEENVVLDLSRAS